jgi:hypothetical protein
MIYCPNCGTANRDGSKFCNECGARLAAPSTGIACPECGTFNPVTRLFCQKCGARLVTVAPEPEPEEPEGVPVTGFSLPSRLLETPPEAEAEGPAAGEEGALIPEWLTGLEPEAAGEEPVQEVPAAPLEEEHLPDWLRELRSGLGAVPEGESVEEAPPEAAPAPSGEGLDWLRELRSGLGPVPEEGAVEEAPPEVPAAPSEEEEGVPDWLRKLRASLPPLEEEGEEVQPPAWLTEEGAAYPQVPVFAEPAVGAEGPLPEEAPPPLEAEAPGAAEALPLEIPPWLEGLEEEAAEEVPPPPPPGEQVSPPWLVGPTPEEIRAPGEAAEAVPPPVEAPLEPGRAEAEEEEMLPEWLRVPPPPPAEAVPAARVPEEGEAVPGEIPPWLAPFSPLARGPAAEGEEGTGLLQGISGLVPAVPEVLEVREEKAKGPAPSPVGASEANLFRRVLAEPPPEEPPARPKAKRFPLWGRWLVSLLLLAAVGIPTVWNGVTGRPLLNLRPAVPPAVQALYAAVEQVQPGEAVLVGWDVDPASAGELLPLAEAILGHLMQRGARLFVVSQLPAGPPLAQETLDGLARTQGVYTYGAHYLNLGYLPGDELGLRALSGAGGLAALDRDYVQGKALAQWEAAAGVQGVDDFRLIVVLASDAQQVRRWIEQVGAQHGVPLVAGVSAGALPALQPYHETEPRQLAGLAGGTPGAAAYESLRGVYLAGQSSMEALAGGVLALAFIVIVGNVALLFGLGRQGE